MTPVDRISYSTAIELKNCGHFFKLKNVDGLVGFDETTQTRFGTLIHDKVQSLLSGGIRDDKIAEFKDEWAKIVATTIPVENKDERELADQLLVAGVNIITHVEQAFKENLPFKRVVSIEERLSTPAIPEKYSQNFKGFIDLILELEDGKIVILDFKTCTSAYMFQQYQDRFKDYQLTLYKHFYGLLKNIPSEKIETYFVLLEKNPKSKKPVQFARVTSGAVKVKNCLEFLDKSLSVINRSVYVKNRMHCRAFGKTCVFYKTEHCT